MQNRKPEILIFAGPNGSGKSTITPMIDIVGVYLNADEIKKVLNISNKEAAIKATQDRINFVNAGKSFTYETVLSTRRHIDLIKLAKEKDFFIKCIYMLTSDPLINVQRVKVRYEEGGHDVPRESIITRYYRALDLLPELVSLCDIIHIYDNTEEPFRIYRNRKGVESIWENDFWTKDDIEKITKKKGL